MSVNLGRIDITYVDRKGLLVGSWFSGISWALLAVQAVLYTRSFPNDRSALKCGVLYLFLSETTLTVLLLVSTYRQLIAVAMGSIESFVPALTLVCMPFLSSICVFGVNNFLIWRYNKLTRRRWLSYLLYAAAVGSMACHLWAVALSVKLRELDMVKDFTRLESAFSQASSAGKAGLATEVALVCIIWLLFLAHLLTLLRRDMQDTRRLVVRLVYLTLESGTAASSIAIASLVYYLVEPTSSNLIVLVSFTSRVYVMGMLFNLNSRASGHIMRESSTNRGALSATESGSVPLSHLQSSACHGSKHYPTHVIRVTQSSTMKVDEHMHDIKIDEEAEEVLHGHRMV